MKVPHSTIEGYDAGCRSSSPNEVSFKNMKDKNILNRENFPWIGPYRAQILQIDPYKVQIQNNLALIQISNNK